MKSSYNENDVKILIKDLTGKIEPVSLEERKRRVDNGEFSRSIMIKEYPISEEYEKICVGYLEDYAKQTADAVAKVSEQIYNEKKDKLVLVSIIRAGIPIGILIKRYLKNKYNVNIPHYAISLVKGLDDNAMKYILERHDANGIQFIDGWTGKGSVTRELVESAKNYPGVDASLAVLSDSINITKYCGVRKDIFIPSAPFNATATGLVSISILKNELIGKNDFHGAIYLKDLESHDHSLEFLNAVEKHFDYTTTDERIDVVEVNEIDEISKNLNIDKSLLNPSINEAARAILRRNLNKLLVCDIDDFDVKVIVELAKLKGVKVEKYPLKYYKAVSVAKDNM